MSGSQDEIPPPPPPPSSSQTPTQQTPHTVSTIKLPILKKGEYDIWAMKIEHYFIIEANNLPPKSEFIGHVLRRFHKYSLTGFHSKRMVLLTQMYVRFTMLACSHYMELSKADNTGKSETIVYYLSDYASFISE
ncbi:hypothetical protein Tco_0032113 [Tanacetum coccineum]